ncbi:serine hydrolase, partial [Francisella tularensis subsp. holarctica]|nr:serine hydrolase [Francisella tularensis subsp. holarctica]
DDNRAFIMAIFYTQSQTNAKPNSKFVREVTKILLNRLQLKNTTKNA